MKSIDHSLLSLAAPMLILIALLSFLNPHGQSKVRAIPCLAVGLGLIVSGAAGRGKRRRKLLLSLKNEEKKYTNNTNK